MIASSRAVIAVMDREEEDWYALANSHLHRAYGDNEPEYSLSQLKEVNKDY